jgi:hypothetical protein
MHIHPLARLTPISRERLIRRHLDEGVPLKALAAEAGISLRSAFKCTSQATIFRLSGFSSEAISTGPNATSRQAAMSFPMVWPASAP